MNAICGDRLVVRRRELGAPNRDGEILEVHGENGAPPYLVRWSDDGRVTLVFPGSDAQVEHCVHTKHTVTPAKAGSRRTKSS